jgi:hypothetical protein
VALPRQCRLNIGLISAGVLYGKRTRLLKCVWELLVYLYSENGFRRDASILNWWKRRARPLAIRGLSNIFEKYVPPSPLASWISLIAFTMLFKKRYDMLEASNFTETYSLAIINHCITDSILFAVVRGDSDKFYLLTSVFVEYDERVEVGGKAS